MKGKLPVAVAVVCCSISGSTLAQERYTSELDASLRLGLGFNTEPDPELTFENYGSRLRWAGSAEAGDGRKAISYLEFGFDQDQGVSTTREAWIGVEADFGVLKGGKQYNAFYDAVTSAVDIAYWGSCYFEIGCGRQSSVIKFTATETNDLQLMASARLESGDPDNDFIDGIDVGARLKSGDMIIGAAGSLLIGNSSGGLDLGTGFGAGVSATKPVGDAIASVSLQFATDDYLSGGDSGFSVTGTYSKDDMYAVAGVADSDNTPFFITLGYVKPIIENKAFTYFEVTAVDLDLAGLDLDLQARAVMVFNMDLLSTGN